MRFGRARSKSKNKGKYKSRLESDFAESAFKANLPFRYETTRFPYTRKAHFVPDWEIAPNVFIETKGYLSPSNRANLISFKEQNPKVVILLLFGNAQNRLNAASKTTYAQWAEKHGFEWWDVHKGLPVHWWKKYAPLGSPQVKQEGKKVIY